MNAVEQREQSLPPASATAPRYAAIGRAIKRSQERVGQAILAVRAMRWRLYKTLRKFAPKHRDGLETEWREDDCLTFAFGKEFLRPHVLDASEESEAFRNAVKHYGSIANMIRGIAKENPAWKEVPVNGEWQVGDVILGATDSLPFQIAKVGESYLPIVRTHAGHDVAHFSEVFSIWRKGT